MRHLGDFIKGATVRFAWNTSGANGASITRATNGTIYVYKDGTLTTEVTTGVTDTEDEDSLTGVHLCEIATTDAFYSVGSEFLVVLKAATIDGVTVNATLAQFSIQRATAMKPVVGTAQGGAVGYVDLPTSASSTNGAYAGAFVRVKHSSGAIEVRRQSATAYVGSTRRFSVDPNFATAPDSSSEVELYLLPPSPTSNLPAVDVKNVNGTAQTAGDLAALITAIKGITDLLTLAAIGQQVLKATTLTLGNKLFIDGTDIVLTDTDGTTEIGRAPYLRLEAPANPLASVGGS
jgi:hypothetical protein